MRKGGDAWMKEGRGSWKWSAGRELEDSSSRKHRLGSCTGSGESGEKDRRVGKAGVCVWVVMMNGGT